MVLFADLEVEFVLGLVLGNSCAIVSESREVPSSHSRVLSSFSSFLTAFFWGFVLD